MTGESKCVVRRARSFRPRYIGAVRPRIRVSIYLSIYLSIYSPTLTLTSALNGGGCSKPRPGCFTPGKETRYPFYRRVGGSQCRSGRVRKNPPLGFDPRTVHQPVASRFSDWAMQTECSLSRSQNRASCIRVPPRSWHRKMCNFVTWPCFRARRFKDHPFSAAWGDYCCIFVATTYLSSADWLYPHRGTRRTMLSGTRWWAMLII
jgi:hypothetical protein